MEISDWFPHIGSCADDIAFIRSMWTTDDNHGAQVQFHSGRHMLDPREPTLGAWVTYGLGVDDRQPADLREHGAALLRRARRPLPRPGVRRGESASVDPKNPLAFAAPEIADRPGGAGRASSRSSTSSTS